MSDAKDGIRCLISIVLLIAVFLVAQSTGGEPAKQVTFDGRVVDQQDRPIPGANVTFYEMAEGPVQSRYRVEILCERTTEADGAFSFSVSEFSGYRPVIVVARKEGLALRWVYWRINADRKCDMVLEAPKQLGGVVVDTDGAPIPEAEVFVAMAKIGEAREESEYLPGSVSRFFFKTKADDSGRFTFGDLPGDATFEFGARKPGYATVTTWQRSRQRSEVYQFAPGRSDVKLAMPVEAVVEGLVVEQGSGRPISGVLVEVRSSQGLSTLWPDPVVSGPDGAFKFNGLQSDLYFTSLARPIEGPADWVAAPAELTLEAGQTKKDVKIEASKGGFLEVCVNEAGSDKPIEGATVNVRESGGRQWFSATSDANGLAKMRLTPGGYQLSGAHKSGYNYLQRQDDIAIRLNQTIRMRVELTAMPKVRGIVREPDGKPAAGVFLQLLPGGSGEGHSDSNGQFEIPWDSSGWRREDTVFCLVARDEQRNLATAVEIGDGAKPLELTLKPGSILAGTTVDPNGEPIAGAKAFAMMHVSNWGSTLNRDQAVGNADGTFQIRAVPADYRYEVRASAEGYGQQKAEVQTDGAGGKTLDVGMMTLPLANLSISGRVVDTEDNPIPLATIQGYGDEQPSNCYTQTDAKGRFVLEGVCARQIRLNVDATFGGERLSAYVITNGRADDIRIVAREGRSPVQYIGGRTYDQVIADAEKVIAGVAVDERGKPVAGVPVGVCCHKRIQENGKPSWMFSSFQMLKATTDDRGRFAIELEEGGAYNLLFSPDHHAAVIAYDVPVGRKDLRVVLPDGGTLAGRLVELGVQGKTPIPDAEVKLEQPDRASYTHLGFDRDRTTTTDAQGRFRFEHIRTQVRPHSSMSDEQWDYVPRIWQLSYGDATETVSFANGDTIDDFEFVIRPRVEDIPTLVGRPWPGFEGIGIGPNVPAKDRAAVVCFFDYQQRPSRNTVLKLARQAESLKAKGVDVLAVQVSEVEATALDSWAKKNDVTFPLGRITGNIEVVRTAWRVKSLPWLVLADPNRTVRAEGFAVDQLEARLGEMTGAKP